MVVLLVGQVMQVERNGRRPVVVKAGRVQWQLSG